MGTVIVLILYCKILLWSIYMQWELTCNILDTEQSGAVSCWRQVFQVLSLISAASVMKQMLIIKKKTLYQ